MKKLFYIANIRMPTDKAHGVQIMHMCDAFAAAGFDVTLVIPNRDTHIAEDAFEYYNLPRTFGIVRLPCFDSVSWGQIGFYIESLSFAISLFFFSILKSNAVWYGRDVIPLCAVCYRKNLLWEAHVGVWNLLMRLLILRAKKIIVISEGIKNYFLSKGVYRDHIFVAPDAVALKRVHISDTVTESLEKLSLPEGKRLILYTGHLYHWKGAHVLARAAQLLPEHAFVFVGGTKSDVLHFRHAFGHLSNVHILGHQPPQKIPHYLFHADIVVLPNSGVSRVSREFTSPLKLFEYMASGKPIVASDLPSIREVLTEEDAYFFIPDNVESLAEVLERVLKEYPLACKKGAHAKSVVSCYSWEKRAERISAFFL